MTHKRCVQKNEIIFLNEIQKSKNVPQILAYSFSPNPFRHSYIMPVYNTTLRTFIKTYKFRETEKLIIKDFILGTVAESIHQKFNVYHCDINTYQVVLDDNLNMLLIDWEHSMKNGSWCPKHHKIKKKYQLYL